MTHTIVGLLNAIMEHKNDLKGSSINKVVRMWLSHYRQFGTFVTKMSDTDRDTLQIADPKVIQGKIDTVPREKALQATTEEKVAFGQLGIRLGSITETNSEAVDLQSEGPHQVSPHLRGGGYGSTE